MAAGGLLRWPVRTLHVHVCPGGAAVGPPIPEEGAGALVGWVSNVQHLCIGDVAFWPLIVPCGILGVKPDFFLAGMASCVVWGVGVVFLGWAVHVSLITRGSAEPPP